MGAKKSFFWEELQPEKLWYLVGLITSDGSLSKDGRHIDITAKEISFLKTIKRLLNIPSGITVKNNGYKKTAHHIQIGSVSFYNFLLSIGLFPNKSLTLGEIIIPDVGFSHFLKGLIDGDGCIRRWTHPTNMKEQWSLRIYSGSRNFLSWLQVRMLDFFGVGGKVYSNNSKQTENSHVLKFGKLAAQKILAGCYGRGDGIVLKRKQKLANHCIRTKRGWSKSKTIDLNFARVAEQADAQDCG